MALSVVDMTIDPTTIKYPLPGIIEISSNNEDAGELHKRARTNEERVVADEQSNTYSVIAMPRNVSSAFHPLLPDAQALTKALVRDLQLFGGEAGSSLSFVIESLATQFSNPTQIALCVSTLTIPAPWITLVRIKISDLNPLCP